MKTVHWSCEAPTTPIVIGLPDSAVLAPPGDAAVPDEQAVTLSASTNAMMRAFRPLRDVMRMILLGLNGRSAGVGRI